MKSLAKKDEPNESEDDEFDAGSDNDGDGGVNLPVSQFQSRFIGVKEQHKTGARTARAEPGKDTLNNLLDLPEDRTSQP